MDFCCCCRWFVCVCVWVFFLCFCFLFVVGFFLSTVHSLQRIYIFKCTIITRLWTTCNGHTVDYTPSGLRGHRNGHRHVFNAFTNRQYDVSVDSDIGPWTQNTLSVSSLSLEFVRHPITVFITQRTLSVSSLSLEFVRHIKHSDVPACCSLLSIMPDEQFHVTHSFIRSLSIQMYQFVAFSSAICQMNSSTLNIHSFVR